MIIMKVYVVSDLGETIGVYATEKAGIKNLKERFKEDIKDLMIENEINSSQLETLEDYTELLEFTFEECELIK